MFLSLTRHQANPEALLNHNTPSPFPPPPASQSQPWRPGPIWCIYVTDLNYCYMKSIALLLTGLTCCFADSTFGANQPRGSVLELHSCEVYAGGCVVSSQSTLEGRYMLRVWNFDEGTFAGTELAGLQLAVLQSSSENLAAPESEPGSAVVYLTAAATSPQRAALLAWLKSAQPDLGHTEFHSRIVPMQFAKIDSGYSFSAGDYLSVKTASLESCETGACGEALWYAPRTSNSVFTVAVDRSSKITEPLLKLNWSDAAKRSVFLAKFGQESASKNLFVTSAELCGPSGIF
jgi:hypothetical protein